ncbi:MAG TPA: hypothetical protein VHT52_23950 [Stellaceae bacterium]|jgi:hypothetical protein|nr:hypothetical protein [Stellaceae bacterium]
MTRDFNEERRKELMADELEKTLRKVFHADSPEGQRIMAIYRQNPLLARLLDAAEESARRRAKRDAKL